MRMDRFHDASQQMVLYGASDELVESFLQGCADNKEGTLFD